MEWRTGSARALYSPAQSPGGRHSRREPVFLLTQFRWRSLACCLGRGSAAFRPDRELLARWLPTEQRAFGQGFNIPAHVWGGACACDCRFADGCFRLAAGVFIFGAQECWGRAMVRVLSKLS